MIFQKITKLNLMIFLKMNHKEICYILEACLLASENCTKEIIKTYGIPEDYAIIGINLYSYLKPKGIKIQNG